MLFHGECWSGPRAACDFRTFGSSTSCQDENSALCQDTSPALCSGLLSNVYVYTVSPSVPTCPTTIPSTPKTTHAISTTTESLTTSTERTTTPSQAITTPIPTGPPILSCGTYELKLTKLGCWQEFGHIRPPRLLPELLLTARDPSSNVYAGYQYNVGSYHDFIKR